MQKAMSKESKIFANKRPKKWIDIINTLSLKYGFKCWYCGADLTGRISIDHIIPKALGGTDDIENIALSCLFCNMAKFKHDLADFLLWLSHIRSSKFSCKILNNLKIEDTEIDRLRKDFGA